VFKEALHNIVKHSQAHRVNVSLVESGGLLEIRIEDDGKGFDPDNASDEGNGLVSMQKRVEALGGSFSIHSFPGKGTQLHFSISLVSAT
jgi:signal transduction histidine kinase